MLSIDTIHVVPEGNAIIAKRMFDSIALAAHHAAN
jgi:hypothetical protein